MPDAVMQFRLVPWGDESAQFLVELGHVAERVVELSDDGREAELEFVAFSQL